MDDRPMRNICRPCRVGCGDLVKQWANPCVSNLRKCFETVEAITRFPAWIYCSLICNISIALNLRGTDEREQYLTHFWVLNTRLP